MFRRILAQPTRIIVYDMRLNWGAVPGSPDFVPDQAWKALKEPSPWAFQVIATPIGIAAASFLGVLWFLVPPLRYISQPLPLASLLFSLPVLVVVHELIHAAVHPMAGRSPHSILGFWPSRVFFYAHYDGELTRDRFLVILLMPFIAISIFPLLIAGFPIMRPGRWLLFRPLTRCSRAATSSERAWCFFRFQLERSLETKAGKHTGEYLARSLDSRIISLPGFYPCPGPIAN